MSDLMVKPVDVLGDTIMAAQDGEGTIWVGVRWMCQGMGMSDGQYKRQIKNIQKDLLLKNSGSNLNLNKGSGERDVFCLKLDYLPIWLAKISITPTIQKDHPELADKLLEYQLKAKDILAEAFMPKQNDFPRTTQAQIQLLAQGNVELNQRVDDVEIRIKDLENTMTLDHGQQYFLEKTVNKTVMSALGGKESNAYKQIGRKVFAECNGNLKAYFKVNARGNVPRKRYDEAVAYAEKWKPCMNTQMMIEQYNAQQTLDLEGGVYHG